MAVYVGDDERPFHIHKKLLCSKSTYFKAAFEGSFKEASEKKLHLLDEDPKIFRFYAIWIYNQDLQIRGKNDEDLNVCCRLYILADKLGSAGLQNIVMDVIHKIIKRRRYINLESENVNFVYNNTLPGSHLRDILVDALAWQMDADSHPDLINAVPEFLYAALKICTGRLPLRLGDEKGPLDMNRCRIYHVHSDGHICSVTPPASNSESESDSKSDSES